MNVAIPAMDALSLVAFCLALVLTLKIPLSEHSAINVVSKACMSLAMAVYVFAMASNVLEHARITSMLDPVEDYLEILFPLLIVYALYAAYVHQRELELVASQRAALRSQEMLLGIMDSAPAGILVLDSTARITFANEAARGILDLGESDGGTTLATPGWSVRVGSQESAPDFSGLVKSYVGAEGVPVAVEWPGGWRVDMTFHTEALKDDAGGVGGLVASFLPPDGLHPRTTV